MYDRVIVPLDEDADTACLGHVRTLARDLCCELTLLHVHHSREALPELESLPRHQYEPAVEAWDERDVGAEADALEWLSGLADGLGAEDPELNVSGRVLYAPLAEPLAAPGEQVLVIAPTRRLEVDGLNWTARELVRSGGVPVLVTPLDRPLLPVREILVALDGSEFSREVLAPALALARAVNARISLVEVVTRHTGLVRMLHAGDRTAEAAERSLLEVRERIPPELGPVDVRVVEDADPVAGIVAEAKRGEADLVAMATHGRGGVRRIIMGSVAESVVRNAQLPVLLFRPATESLGRVRGASTEPLA